MDDKEKAELQAMVKLINHRAKVEMAARQDIVSAGVDGFAAMAIVAAISAGKVRNVTISYEGNQP